MIDISGAEIKVGSKVVTSTKHFGHNVNLRTGVILSEKEPYFKVKIDQTGKVVTKSRRELMVI